MTDEHCALPNPTEAMLADPIWEAIWQTIKSWDVNVPGYYEGYCGADGSHVTLIYEALARQARPASDGLVERCRGIFDAAYEAYDEQLRNPAGSSVSPELAAARVIADRITALEASPVGEGEVLDFDSPVALHAENELRHKLAWLCHLDEVWPLVEAYRAALSTRPTYDQGVEDGLERAAKIAAWLEDHDPQLASVIERKFPALKGTSDD